jgi:3-oxoacyl-[acyl-carrier protein] reductase
MNRRVLVTGASGAIGSAIALAFAGEGDNVVLGCRSGLKAAQNLCAEIEKRGGRALAVAADIAREEEVEMLFAAAEKVFGPVQVLVNNAGIAQQKLFGSLSAQEWDDMFAVHVRGAFLCSRRALPSMIRQKDGCILNIASMWGQVGASCESHYAAAKAALMGLTKSLAKEEGPSGVRVNCIAPGAIGAGMSAQLAEDDKKALCEEIPLGYLGKPEDVAAAAVFLASEGARYITGQVLGVNGGMVV